MLTLTRLSGQSFALNPDLIERAEATPDTVVTLVNGSKYVIGETLDELVALVRDYRAAIVQTSRAIGEPAYRPRSHPRELRDTSGLRSAGGHDTATVVLLHTEPGGE